MLVARVTADIDTLSRFTEWGGVAWIVAIAQIAGSLVLMLIYCWQLAIPVVLLVVPTGGDHVSDAADPVRCVRSGAHDGRPDAVRGIRERDGGRGRSCLRARGPHGRASEGTRSTGDIGRRWRPICVRRRCSRWRPSSGASRCPSSSYSGPCSVLSGASRSARPPPSCSWRTCSCARSPTCQRSTRRRRRRSPAGGRSSRSWTCRSRSSNPSPAATLPRGPVSVRAEGVGYAYSPGRPVVHDVDLRIEPGAHMAIVGETGSGKTTFAKLLARLADPRVGRILLDDVDLREVAPAARRTAVRMVPQDGFLFDLSIRENIRVRLPGRDRPRCRGRDPAVGARRLGGDLH